MINQPNRNNTEVQSDRIEIVFYTDPLCCWSWALLPELLKLSVNFSDSMSLSLCMGGLIKDWSKFSDPINNINRPSQMGPMWMEASKKTGITMDASLWVKDPPSSSYPACIAVKTAELQSLEAGISYFRLLTEAAMEKGMNIAKPEVLVSVAKQLANEVPEVFNLKHFLTNYNNTLSREAFRADLQKARYHKIGRFPTLIMSGSQGKSIMITGYRSYDILVDALGHIMSNCVEAVK